MLASVTFPGFSARLAGARDCPNPPRLFSVRNGKGGKTSTRALLAAGTAGDHQVSRYQRRRRSVVVLVPIGHFGVPFQAAGIAVQSKEMGSIGDHENSIALPGRTPIDVHRAATHDPF